MIIGNNFVLLFCVVAFCKITRKLDSLGNNWLCFVVVLSYLSSCFSGGKRKLLFRSSFVIIQLVSKL